MRGPAENFYAALKAAGMPEAPGVFSVVPQHQVISSAILAGISDFIRCFDRVTARKDWQAAALCKAPAIAQLRRHEVCFFSAWDFHLPAGGSWQLIEFNDNGLPTAYQARFWASKEGSNSVWFLSMVQAT